MIFFQGVGGEKSGIGWVGLQSRLGRGLMELNVKEAWRKMSFFFCGGPSSFSKGLQQAGYGLASYRQESVLFRLSWFHLIIFEASLCRTLDWRLK